MTFAAVIPLYNKEHSIVRALRSVSNQTRALDEVLVINDGSTDGSLEAARSLALPKIQIHSTPNRGESEARNLGVLMTRADVILFLDADDEWRPEFAGRIADLFRD